MKLNILLVSSAFYSELSPRSFRATELAKEFCRLGHQVVVISKHREIGYSEFQKEYPVTLKMWRKPFLPRIFSFKKSPFTVFGRIISRTLSLLFEYPDIEETFQARKMLKSEDNIYDLMVSFAVPFPVHWGVAWARSKNHPIAKTWIADCGDPYMFCRLDTFRKPFYFKMPEMLFCRRCDYLTVPFNDMRDQFYPEFRSKIKVIPQGFNFKEITLCTEKQEYMRPVFVFAGSIIPGKRDLTLLLNFLSTLSSDFQFIVYTNQNEWFRSFKNVLGDKLVLNGYIDRLSLIYEMSKVDFLVNVDTILDNRSNIEAIPSKLIDYALAKRPILNIHSSELDEAQVLAFLDGNYSGQRVVDISEYDIRKVAAKFLELL